MPVVEDEPEAVVPLAGVDLADEQHVVARAMDGVVPAFEPRDAAFDQRRAGGTDPVGHAREAVGMGPREAAGELDLVVRQHVDGVTLGGPEGREVAAGVREAPDDERRIERHRVERVRGKADETAVPGVRANDRDAGGELRQRIAKVPFGERRRRRGSVIVAGSGLGQGSNRGDAVGEAEAVMVAAAAARVSNPPDPSDACVFC